jgi:hypothetical protein
MQLLIALIGLLVLIPAALAGIVAGFRDLSANSSQLMSHLDQLMVLGQSLWPLSCALALIVGGIVALSVGFWLLMRGLQSFA